MSKSIYMSVTDGDGTGNNPVRIQDGRGYGYLLWGRHASKLGLKKGMNGRLVFITNSQSEVGNRCLAQS